MRTPRFRPRFRDPESHTHLPSSEPRPRLPLAAPALWFTVGGLGGVFGVPSGGILALAIALLSIAVAWTIGLHRSRRHRSLARALLAIAIPVTIGVSAAPSPAPGPPILPRGPVSIEGTVVGPPTLRRESAGSGRQTRFTIHRLRVSGSSVEGALRVQAAGEVAVGRGDRVRFIARGGSRGFVRIPPRGAIEILEQSWLRPFDRWRALWRQRLERTTSPRVAAWSTALLLGERAALPAETERLFRDTGQSHLLAISGLHVGLWVWWIGAIGRRVPARAKRAPRTLARLAWIIAFGSYALVTGAHPPVLRAVIFFLLAAGFRSTRSRARLPELWLATYLLLAIATPDAERIGFWLSFAAVGGIALVLEASPRDREEIAARRPRPLRALRVACAAWLGAQIVLPWWTADVVPWGPLISLALAPWLATVLLGGAVVSVIPSVSPLLDLLLRLGEGMVSIVDRLPATPATLPPMPPLAASLVAAALLGLLCRHVRLGSALAIAAIALIFTHPASDDPRLVTRDLGRGQGVYLLTGETTLLFDAGSVDFPAGGGRALRRLLWEEGRPRIDAIVLSHPHADHVLALPDLIGRVDVGSVFVGPRFSESSLGAAMEQFTRRAGVPWRVLSKGDRVAIGDLTLEALAPAAQIPPGLTPLPNDDSLVIAARGAFGRVIAAGDLEGAGLAACAPPNRPTVLILPHHGRDAPGLAHWLRRSSPQIALACGTIRPTVMTPLATVKSRILQTDRRRHLTIPLHTGADRNGSSR